MWIGFRFPPDVLPLLTRSLHSILPKPKPDKKRISDPVPSRAERPFFHPYVAKVPWHGGPRGFLSQLFPRYGHYCGPNWSSGKDGGSMLWDRRPIDWLDFCCYCHDIGYDTHDQAGLLRADLAFLDCLERPRTTTLTAGDTRTALLYRSMCITGLRNILIPYRMQLVRLHSGRTPLSDVLENFMARRTPFSEALGNLMSIRMPFWEMLGSFRFNKGLRNILIPYRMQLVRLHSGRTPLSDVLENFMARRTPFSEALGNLMSIRMPFWEMLGSFRFSKGNDTFRQNSE